MQYALKNSKLGVLESLAKNTIAAKDEEWVGVTYIIFKYHTFSNLHTAHHCTKKHQQKGCKKEQSKMRGGYTSC